MNPDNQQTKPKSDCLPSFTCQLGNETVRRSLVHLQCSTLKATLIIKNSRRAREWVCEFCVFKELPFSGLSEFQEITVTTPTTIYSVEYENIHILVFKSDRKHLSIGHLITQSMVLSYTLTLSETRLCKFVQICSNTWL